MVSDHTLVRVDSSACYLHWVGGPDDKGEETERAEQLDDLGALGLDCLGAMDGNVPDDEDVRDQGDGVPAPALGRVLTAVGGEKTGEDHDEIGGDGHEGVGTIDTGQQGQVEQDEGRGDGQVDVTGEGDLAADVVEGIRDVVVVVPDLDAVQAGAMAGGQAKVGQSTRDGDQGGDDVVDTLRDGDVPGQQGEEAAGDQQDDEDNP